MNEDIEMKWYQHCGKVVSEREMKCKYGECVAKGCMDPAKKTYEVWLTDMLRYANTSAIPKENMKTFHVYGTATMTTAFDMEAPNAETAKVEAEIYLNGNGDCLDYETSSWEAEVE